MEFFLGMTSETSVAICSMIFGGVLEKFPKLKVCFAHGGKVTTLLLSYWSKSRCDFACGLSLNCIMIIATLAYVLNIATVII